MVSSSPASGLEFRHIGGSIQPVAENFDSLKAVLELDEALFAVTGLDIISLRANPKFLEYLDTDKNGKIRTDELKEAIAFMLDALKDGTGVDEESAVLDLNWLDKESATGLEIYRSAKQVLHNIGKEAEEKISLDDLKDQKQINSCVTQNGDGIVTSDSAAPELVRTIDLAVKFTGGSADVSGGTGINGKQLDDFVAAAKTLIFWHKEADGNTALLPFGERTHEIYGCFSQIKTVVDDYFLSSETLAFLDTDPERLAKKDSIADVRTPADVMQMLRKIAIASPSPDGKLDLGGAINPLWADRIGRFAALPEVGEYLDDRKLSAESWRKFSARIAPAADWYERRPALPALFDTTRQELEDAVSDEHVDAVKEMIAKDIEAGTALAGIEKLHKLILFQCNMLDFLKNFLNLGALFEPGIHSLLQTGRLIMDGRHFSLAVPVSNLAEHKSIVLGSNICVAYVEVSRGLPAALKKQLLAVAITSGNMRNLFPGKRGVFFDAAGDVYDAKITDFLRQPVSVSEALKSPFLRLGEFLGKQADKMMTAKSNEAQQDLGKAITSGKLPQQETKQNQGVSGSMLLMGGGIGLAAIGSSVAFIVKSLQNISIMNIIAVLIGIVVVFGGPIVVISLIKLYRRDLGRFLEASGCALNFPMRLSWKLGNFFTMAPKRPNSSYLSPELKARTEKRKYIFRTILLIILLLLLAGTLVARRICRESCEKAAERKVCPLKKSCTAPKPAVKADVKPAVKADAKPAVKADAKPAVKADAKPAVKADAKPAVKADAKDKITGTRSAPSRAGN
ncbi:MAG: hypothetical protein IJU70_01790 [Lentisphaeria bacterium]|nr:hypothetical protein [Lentisphaeria bacterium]